MSELPVAIIAENDRDMRNALRMDLVELGMRVLLVANGNEAKAFAAQLQAALVILDVDLPEPNARDRTQTTPITAYEACLHIRRLAGYGRTPILMVCRRLTERVQRAASRAEASMVLCKPYSKLDLLNEIVRLITGSDNPLTSVLAGHRATGRGRVADPGGQVWLAPGTPAWRGGDAPRMVEHQRTLQLLRLQDTPRAPARAR